MKSNSSSFYFILLLFAFILCSSCHKEGCVMPDIIPSPTYDDPVWHPGGKLIGFNYKPLKTITKAGQGNCTWYEYDYKMDSAGFWLINEDGTGMHKALPFTLIDPAWSPDGKWIAFSAGGMIYKMPFDGVNFDTTNIIQLTTQNKNLNPSWNPIGDSIAFESWDGGQHSLYRIWEMDSNGYGKAEISPPARSPSWFLSNRIVHLRYEGESPQIFIMDADGKEVKQVTKDKKFGIEDIRPIGRGSSIFFIAGGSPKLALFKIDTLGNNEMQLTTNGCTKFSIGPDGRIVYLNYIGDKLDRDKGVLWIINDDGTDKKQLTQNDN